MSERQNAAPMDQIGSGDGGQLSFGEVRLPDPDSIMPRPGAQAVSISSLLLRGSANAVPLQHLQRMTGLEERVIRRMIWRERQGGACICVNCRDGYFLAASEAEREACARSMLHRSEEIRRTAEAIAAAEVET